MGDLVKLSKDEWVPWTGGKPNYDWTSLDFSEALRENTSPNQLRGEYAAAAQKGYNYRRTGLTTVFKKNDELQVFVKNVWNHLLDTGMDTIAYLRDPEYSDRMTDVVHGHSRFTVASTKKLSKDQAPLLDKYDRTNDKAARTFLLASLETNLRNRVEEKLEDSDSFAVTWLTFIKSIQSTSIDRFNSLKTRIKARSAAQYPGENLEALARDFRKDAQELETAGQYDHLLTLDMIKAFLLAGGQGNEDYRFNLRPMKQKLETALLDIAYKTKEAANKHMKDEELTYNDVCILAEDTYRLLFDKKEWPPAQNVRDSKAPRAAYVGEVGSTLTEAQVLALIQSHAGPSSGGAGKKHGTCHHCKKPGHWKNECPDLKSNKGQSGGDSGGAGTGGGKQQGRGADGKGGSGGWRTTPPKAGEPETKMVNGRKFDYCLKCKRWTTTHNTATHTGKPADGKKPQAHGQLAFVPDPFAWMADVSNDDETLEWNEIWTLFMPYLLCSFIGLIVGQICSPQTMFWFVVTLLWENPLALMGPFMWISCIGAIYHWGRAPPDPDPDPWPSFNRQERRSYQKASRTARRRSNFGPGSIRDHGFHRKYPRHLRTKGLYTGKAPTVTQQDLLRKIQSLHFHVQKLTVKVVRLLNSHPSRRVGKNLDQVNITCSPSSFPSGKPGRKGGNVTTRANVQPRRRAHGRRPDESQYRPAPPMGLVWSQAMRTTAKKLAVHALMANPESTLNPATLRMALQAPVKFRTTPTGAKKLSEYPVIWDTGASISITMDRGDFVGPIKRPGIITSVTGLSNGLRIEGEGHVMWAVQDENGNLRCI